jgi:hypothetical protein
MYIQYWHLLDNKFPIYHIKNITITYHFCLNKLILFEEIRNGIEARREYNVSLWAMVDNWFIMLKTLPLYDVDRDKSCPCRHGSTGINCWFKSLVIKGPTLFTSCLHIIQYLANVQIVITFNDKKIIVKSSIWKRRTNRFYFRDFTFSD